MTDVVRLNDLEFKMVVMLVFATLAYNVRERVVRLLKLIHQTVRLT